MKSHYLISRGSLLAATLLLMFFTSLSVSLIFVCLKLKSERNKLIKPKAGIGEIVKFTEGKTFEFRGTTIKNCEYREVGTNNWIKLVQ